MRSLNACLETEGGVFHAEKASGALSSGGEGGSNESTEWHSCSSVLVATQGLQYRERSADTAGEASDESSQWGGGCSARRWTQGVKASAGRRRRILPDDSETSDNDHVAVNNASVKPFDLCEQFKEKVTLEGETCPGQKEVTEGSQSEQENASHGYCSGSDRETGVFGDIMLEPQSMSVAQVGSPRVSSTTRPTAPGDSSPDGAVLFRRKPGKQRRFVFTEDDSDCDEPIFGRIDNGKADLSNTTADAATTTTDVSRREAKRGVSKAFPIESSVLVTASAPSRASSGGEEHVECDRKSPAPLNNLGVRKNRRSSHPSSGGGVDYDDDNKYADVIRKTPGKQSCGRRRFVLESSDDSSAKERGGKCEPVIGSTCRVSPLLGGVSTAGVPPSLVEGVAAASVRCSPYRSEESDHIGKEDCEKSSDSHARWDSVPRGGFASGAGSDDDWKPYSRKLDHSGSRYPGRRYRNVMGYSSSGDENDSVPAGSPRLGDDDRAQNGPLSPGRRRLKGFTSPPLEKPGHERRLVDASESESMSYGATPRRLGCSPVWDEDQIACSSIGSGIDDDRQGGERSTERLSKGSRRIPIPRGRVPRQGGSAIGVGYGVEMPSVASDIDCGASSRDSIPLGGHVAGGLTSPVRRRRARRQNGMGRTSASVQISEESTKEDLSGPAFSKARDRCSTYVCMCVVVVV